MRSSLQKCVFIMGPTASGKTELAIQLNQHLPCRIINVDATQVYRGLNIGAAKLSSEDLKQTPHSLLDIREAWHPYSAADFRDDALTEINQALLQNQLPVLVGGTMLYFKALEFGLADMPPADESIRKELTERFKSEGGAKLHQILEKIDPTAANRIHANDPQRLLRALEVHRLTGQTLSYWQAQQQAYKFPYEILKLIICPEPRSALHKRIEQRIDTMMANGLVNEVQSLMAQSEIHADLPAMRSVGYRQVIEGLKNQADIQEIKLKILYATRQLAKRQLTWLRKEHHAKWYNSLEPDWVHVAKQEVVDFAA